MNAPELIAQTRSDNAPALARTLFALLRKLHCGTLQLTTPDGEMHFFTGSESGPRADLEIRDWKVIKEMLKAAEIGMAECYRDGRLITSDLTHLLELCVLNERALESVFYGKPLVALFYRLMHKLRSNTKSRAKKNIHAHYDLGNEFYALWLDPGMTYSSGLFAPATDNSLEAAQEAKNERILQVLDPKPGEHILEIGCGWGGFAEHAARTRGVSVTGITLSPAQLKFAQSRIDKAGLGSLVELKLIDYRDLEQQFDYVVSVEMFEAVGERYWPTYFKQLRECVKPGGRAIVQAITIAEDTFDSYRANSDFIREFIFPGGMLAPLPRFIAEAEAQGLRAGEPFLFGMDYAETLKRWREKFNGAHEQVKRLGFDDKFLQIWRFYLCYCEAGFRTDRTNVMQIELRRE